ncbi:unannotated protein [freshwater metagenome]|uniref:Unannotated protein n=1 Tax=freshwater metagenome TaxID=449393 RepID=A0A6J6AUP4_9ZZZZ|nr:hypothetical protein [Actinomycetota bacterium]MSW98570.1 hypothetical protein [Actinomycetota bacterium]MSY82020.1 hypothetical protein [Actinomycetota bacterium]MSZ45883.1 hypothetical protein [Actinomycetota bacterium]MTA04098.1 hypothetical protein [Actinomycetota bacterium]
MNQNKVNCDQALAFITLILDDETSAVIDISQDFNSEFGESLTIHFQECSPCESEMAHEREVLNTLKKYMTNECCEQAPEELQQRLHEQTELLAAQMAAQAGFAGLNLGGLPGVSTQVTTTYSRTEITIDGETHVEIETSHEIRHDF